MTLTSEVLPKLAAAPEDRLQEVLAVLDGRPGDLRKGKVSIDGIMSSYGVSRATVYRRLTAAGLQAEMIMNGRKQYDEAAVMRAMAGIPPEGKMEMPA